ncbi:putative UBX domain protein [Aspergillus campestris IBT 28561]|uniref:UBX domain protein n=1 Tax=Aspergillus campestris (strain IBT 28561) TaxID=1392248 RepID=A0A2I1CX03_ASPC2|nr:putative UBX domain protein [Aspergillus campestris IBT 28561]PKY02158.1 putative UBX domain protein [Aspergillus campestris IBT 28561]
MSSHVVVLDSTARRATIKTTPGKHLTDILQEACTKLGVDASQHGLKYNTPPKSRSRYKGKQLDLSLALRLSGLTSGAKLELVQLSRSPSVVTVALQLPESEVRGAPSGRVLDKFPSTTTIWLILRKFEAGVAGSTVTRNLTGRGIPVTSDGGGAGRLFYETPVVQALGRELSSFTDLQKTLAQLGFNSGNVLLRLSFRRTEEPLEEAMVKIQEFFKASGEEDHPTYESASSATQQAQTGSEHDQTETQPADTTSDTHTTPSELPGPSSSAVGEPTEPSSAATGRPVTVFSPPTNTTPQSAQTNYNDSDYIPSVDHAQAHQRRLNASSRNQRLPTDAEMAAQAAAEEERRAGVKEVDVKVRLPDQSQVVAKFSQSDTGKTLYDFVRSCLAAPFAAESFVLTQSTVGPPAKATKKLQSALPDSDKSLLIKNLGLAGRVLINFSWHESASSTARQAKKDLLKPELRTQAQDLKVEQPAEMMDTSEDGPAPQSASDRQEGGKPARKPGSLPKWLKLPGKK